jgi:hypothetical protein
MAEQPLEPVTVTEYEAEDVAVMDLVICPLLQRYDVPKLAVKTTLSPEQKVNGSSSVTLIVAVGKALTVTTVGVLADDIQPSASVAVTVYEAAVEAVYEGPVPTVDDPLLQEYVEPPPAVKTTLPPEQKVVVPPAVIDAIGKAIGCVIVTEAVAVQALASVTVTE